MPDNISTAEPGKPRRRWFQFRLRTLLIAVALLAIPCSYACHQAKVVWHRAAERRLLENQGASFSLADNASGLAPGLADVAPSRLRIVLGDSIVEWIRVPNGSASIVNQAERDFPEAIVVSVPTY